MYFQTIYSIFGTPRGLFVLKIEHQPDVPWTFLACWFTSRSSAYGISLPLPKKSCQLARPRTCPNFTKDKYFQKFELSCVGYLFGIILRFHVVSRSKSKPIIWPYECAIVGVYIFFSILYLPSIHGVECGVVAPDFWKMFSVPYIMLTGRFQYVPFSPLMKVTEWPCSHNLPGSPSFTPEGRFSRWTLEVCGCKWIASRESCLAVFERCIDESFWQTLNWFLVVFWIVWF